MAYGTCGTPVVHLWYIDLVLATLDMSDNHIIGFLLANNPYILNFRSLLHAHGLEEAPVVH